MDFIDWCHRVLQTLEDERFNPHLDTYQLQSILFGDFAKQPNFHTSDQRHGMFHALKALADADLAEEGNHDKWKITPLGREVLANPIPYWAEICAQEIEPEETALLRLVNGLSPHQGTAPDCAWLVDVGADPILQTFNIEPPPGKTNDHLKALNKYIYDLPKLLADRVFLKTKGVPGYHNNIKPTYQGLVWETRRDFTLESQFIDALIREWETTNVDFKRQFGLDTQKQKAEFAKDVLGLVTTKSSGRRYMIIGFDDKTRQYYGPPDPTVTQNRMEQVLANLTDPVVTIRYETIEYRGGGMIGKLELIREPHKLPYRAAQDVFDDKGKKALEKDTVYVRHGSQTEPPTVAELSALEEEGRQARGE